jgi:hypothetical protein
MHFIRDIYAAKRAARQPVVSFEFFPPKTDEGDRNLLEKHIPALLAARPEGAFCFPVCLTRIFHKFPPERRLAADFSWSESPKPVTDRRSTRSPIQSGCEISGLPSRYSKPAAHPEGE